MRKSLFFAFSFFCLNFLSVSASAVDRPITVQITNPLDGQKIELPSCQAELSLATNEKQFLLSNFPAGAGKGFLLRLSDIFAAKAPEPKVSIPEFKLIRKALAQQGISGVFASALRYLAKHPDLAKIPVLIVAENGGHMVGASKVDYMTYHKDLTLLRDNSYDPIDRQNFLMQQELQGDSPLALFVLNRAGLKLSEVPSELIVLHELLHIADILRIMEKAKKAKIEAGFFPRMEGMGFDFKESVIPFAYLNFFVEVRAYHAQFASMRMRKNIPPSVIQEVISLFVKESLSNFGHLPREAQPLYAFGLIHDGFFDRDVFDSLAKEFNQWIEKP
jgi:hypothetical protein